MPRRTTLSRAGLGAALCMLCACGELLDLDRYRADGVNAGGSAGAPSTAMVGSGGATPGRVEWAKRYGDAAAQVPSALGVSSDGAVVFGGQLEGVLDVGCGSCVLAAASESDPFIAAVDMAGNGLWGLVLEAPGPASLDTLWSLGETMWAAGTITNGLMFGGMNLATSDGDVFFGALGALTGSVLQASVLTEPALQENARIAVTAFGEAALIADHDVPSGLYAHMFDGAGGTIWSRTYGSGAEDVVQALALDSERNLVVAGTIGDSVDYGCQMHLASDTDAYVVKLNYSTGSCMWSRTFGGAGEQRALALSIDGAGNVLVGGFFDGSITIGSDVVPSEQGSVDGFVVMLDENGSDVWHLTSRGVGAERVAAAAFTESGRIALAGDFDGALGFDDRQAMGSTPDGFVLVLESDRTLRWSAQLEGGGGERFVALAGRDEHLWALGELSSNTTLEGWFLDNEGGEPSIVLASFIE